ncbi:MAG: alpha/beta hydrolase [bacterium]|nr:alpha/beta hydrolase [bacterium]
MTCADRVGRTIHVWSPEVPQAVFVAVHGAMAHGGDYCTPALWFKDRGLATVSFDLRGHDRKKKVFIPRFDAFLDDLELFVDWVRERFPDLPLILLGHSMGALILTHYGLRRMPEADPRIRGFVLSSPYYRNALAVPRVLIALSGVLSAVVPKMKVPVEDFTEVLTHDSEITDRHRADAADDLRATQVSARFGRELLNAQAWVMENIHRWRRPLLAILAGDDHLADSREGERLLGLIDERWATVRTCPGNYHENLNELGREQTFEVIEGWVRERMK